MTQQGQTLQRIAEDFCSAHSSHGLPVTFSIGLALPGFVMTFIIQRRYPQALHLYLQPRPLGISFGTFPSTPRSAGRRV